MRLCLISDTHGFHRKIELPEADMIIHGGDYANSGRRWNEFTDFAGWWNGLPYKYKCLINGNHDVFAQSFPEKIFPLFKNTHILQDSGVKIEGIKFWGSPWTPNFYSWIWAFNAARGNEIKEHWDLIPDDTEVLVTHGPPWGTLDVSFPGTKNLGCEELAKAVERIKPKIHVFGHIHGDFGQVRKDDTLFLNVSQLDESYNLVNEPVVVEI